MKEPSQEMLDLAIELIDGEEHNQKEIRDQTGLNPSQLFLLRADHLLPDKDRVKEKDRTGAKVKQLRDADVSWGMIAVMFGYKEYPESKIRKMYEEFTGDRSQGGRTGKGGAYFANEPKLYAGARRRVGIAIPKTIPLRDLEPMVAALDDNEVALRPNGKVAARTGTRASAKKAPGVKTAKVSKPAKATKAVKKTVTKKATKATA